MEVSGSSAAGMAADMLGSITSLLPILAGRPADENSTYNYEQMASKMIGSIPDPYGISAIVSHWMRTSSNINQAAGTGMNSLNSDQASALGMNTGERIGSNILSGLWNTFIPGFGGFIKKTNTANLSFETNKLRGAYSGSVGNIDAAMSLGNRRFLGSTADRANGFIDNSNQMNELIGNLGIKNDKVITSAQYVSDNLDRQYRNTMSGKTSQNSNMAVGKEGLKLPPKEELARVIALMNKYIEAFAEGGKIGIDTNVIPEGALHAHKNNLEEINPELNAVTEKGIPIIVTDESADYQQIAEVEREELILNKELTDKIEKLWKENTPQSMIDAGKLLAEALIENTVDNTKEMLNGDDKD